MRGALYYAGGVIAMLCCITSAEVKASSCVTPSGVSGKCVPLEQCSNLFAFKQLSQKVSEKAEKYLTEVECTLKDSSEKGVCCQLDRIFQLPKICGVSANDRIAHGNETAVFEFPWMALLMYRVEFSDELQGNCGGTLISDRYVLTAAHCLKRDERVKLEYVRLGEHTISQDPDCTTIIEDGEVIERDCADPVENVPIESYVVHEKYRSSFLGNDIALIRLAKVVTFKSHIQPICLPMSAKLKETLLPKYIASGWGLTEQLERSDVLLKAELLSINRTACQKRIDEIGEVKIKGNWHNVTIGSKQICADGVNLVDTCRGDSGGPLMWPVDYFGRTRYVQFGVISYGVDSCGAVNFPAVFARVGNYLSWILLNMKA
ncbi:serine protease grass-like [Wyeomyia smithii]|uniref:serine protease grass-like n=1 Tax=Wyeomyia smithii TaxID=174621 RepID=UPI0024681C7C|nr:serine protease grass-like [Wyeomyia smithii]